MKTTAFSGRASKLGLPHPGPIKAGRSDKPIFLNNDSATQSAVPSQAPAFPDHPAGGGAHGDCFASWEGF